MLIPTSANPPRQTLVYNSPALKLPSTLTPQSRTVAPFESLDICMFISSAFSIITSTVFLASKFTLTIFSKPHIILFIYLIFCIYFILIF